MPRNVDPLNMCHLCTINDINNNECISLTQNTLTFKIGFRAFLSALNRAFLIREHHMYTQVLRY